MLLSEILLELKQVGRKGITLGDRDKFFPHSTGAQYQIDTSKRETNPDLSDAEVSAIRCRFGIAET